MISIRKWGETEREKKVNKTVELDRRGTGMEPKINGINRRRDRNKKIEGS